MAKIEVFQVLRSGSVAPEVGEVGGWQPLGKDRG